MDGKSIYEITNTENFQEGKIKVVKSEATTFALVKSNGRFYAFKHSCPHHGANFKDGIISGKTIICPWHHAHFDLETGEMLEPPGPESLEMFHVFEKDGRIYVDLFSAKKPEAVPVGKTYSANPAYVIIGAGAAGAAAAETLRKNDFNGRIILISKEETEYYDRTLLSKEFLSEGKTLNRIPVRSGEFYRESGIERVTGDVEALDIKSRKVICEDGSEIFFDKLLIATGGVPFRPQFPGNDSENVYTLRSLPDAEKIRQAAERCSKAVIIGASFIGMECAASLRKLGLDITVTAIENLPFENVLGKEVGKSILKDHEAHGVEFHMGQTVKRIFNKKSNVMVELANGTILEGGFAILGTGVRPATAFIDSSMLERDGSLKVDANMHVMKAPENIFAAGDIASFPYKGQGNHIRVEHWRVAEQLGICAAKNMCGQKCGFDGIPLFWTDQFDINLCYVGYSTFHNEVFVDGNPEEDFIAFYVKGNKIESAAGKWRDADMCAIEERMKKGNMPSADKIKSGFREWQDFSSC